VNNAKTIAITDSIKLNSWILFSAYISSINNSRKLSVKKKMYINKVTDSTEDTFGSSRWKYFVVGKIK
jgi:hypothetical protein